MTEINNANVEYCEAEVLDENYENSGSGHGLIGVGVALGGVALAAGAAFAANKLGKFDEMKAKHRIKKAEKLEKKLGKVYAKIEEGSVEKKDSVEEE